MALAEMLKVTCSVNKKITDVDETANGVDETAKRIEGEVLDVRGNLQDVRGKVEGIEGNLQVLQDGVKDIGDTIRIVGGDMKDVLSNSRNTNNKLDQVIRSYLLTHAYHSESSDGFTGNELRDSLLRWLSAPDPFTNHNTARKVHHRDTSRWFFQGGIFNQWRSSGSLLWIHGKRLLLLTFNMRCLLIISHFYSRFRENCALVRSTVTSTSCHCKPDIINLAPRS